MSSLRVRGRNVRRVVRGTEAYLASYHEKLIFDQRDTETFRTRLKYRLLRMTVGSFRRVNYTLQSRSIVGRKGPRRTLRPCMSVTCP